MLLNCGVEKTLESPLDCKEIQLVHPKGDQSWVFIGRPEAKAEIDVFLELSCFFDNSADVGNLISGSSAFSKTSLNIWKFMVHILLKPGLENFEHYFTSV